MGKNVTSLAAGTFMSPQSPNLQTCPNCWAHTVLVESQCVLPRPGGKAEEHKVRNTQEGLNLRTYKAIKKGEEWKREWGSGTDLDPLLSPVREQTAASTEREHFLILADSQAANPILYFLSTTEQVPVMHQFPFTIGFSIFCNLISQFKTLHDVTRLLQIIQ